MNNRKKPSNDTASGLLELSAEEKRSLMERKQEGDRLTIAEALEMAPNHISAVWRGTRTNERVWRFTKKVIEARERIIREAQGY